MSRTWQRIEISVLLASLAAAVAIAGAASAQSDENSRSDDRQAASESSQNSNNSSSEEQGNSRATRNRVRDRDQARDRDRDRDSSEDNQRSEQSESRSRSTWRDQFRGAPQMYGRQSSDEGRSDEQGGLGVAVEDDEQGVRVVRVYGGTPAQEMGLREGDRITQVDGRRVESARQFISRIRNMEPGDEVELDILRNRDERSLSGELESREEALRFQNRQSSQNRAYSDGDSREGTYTTSRSDRGDALNRLYAIERQLDELRRELQQLKSSLQQQRDGNSESSVIYYEDQSRSGGDRFSTRQSQYEDASPRFDNRRGSGWGRADEDRSPGGVTGEGRLHVTGRESNE